MAWKINAVASQQRCVVEFFHCRVSMQSALGGDVFFHGACFRVGPFAHLEEILPRLTARNGIDRFVQQRLRGFKSMNQRGGKRLLQRKRKSRKRTADFARSLSPRGRGSG